MSFWSSLNLRLNEDFFSRVHRNLFLEMRFPRFINHCFIFMVPVSLSLIQARQFKFVEIFTARKLCLNCIFLILPQPLTPSGWELMDRRRMDLTRRNSLDVTSDTSIPWNYPPSFWGCIVASHQRPSYPQSCSSSIVYRSDHHQKATSRQKSRILYAKEILRTLSWGRAHEIWVQF